jgi:FG-GAP repeat
VGQSNFGVRLALSDDGTTLLVGGNQDAGGVGAGWVFVRSGSTWTRQSPKLTATDEQGSANFGIRVALAGDGRTALIGGWSDDGGVGAAWVFTRSGSTWTQQRQKLRANDEQGPGAFGGGLALSANGDTALISAERDNNDIGAAWIFTRTSSKWSQHGSKLTATGETGNAFFGKTVALSADGTLALIGGHVDNAEAGAAWVFTRTGAAWLQQGPKLTGSGEIGAGAFGLKLALSADGNTALIGGTDDDNPINRRRLVIRKPGVPLPLHRDRRKRHADRPTLGRPLSCYTKAAAGQHASCVYDEPHGTEYEHPATASEIAVESGLFQM